MKQILPIPKLEEHKTAGQKCYAGRAKDLRKIDYPPNEPEMWNLPPDWKQRAIRAFDQIRRRDRSVQLFMDICVRCGACADKCQFFQATGDPKNMPVARAELLRKFYRRYFTLPGRIIGALTGKDDLTVNMLKEWYVYFYQCSECRRCSVFCPYGIDTATITMAAREVLLSLGIGTKYITEVVAKVYDIGNNLGIPPAAWKDSAQFLEGEVKEETGLDIKCPVDEKGAEVLLVPPSADMFANADTTIGYMKMFHACGVSWTTSTYASEGGNFGMFVDYKNMKKVNQRILKAARELKVKSVVWGECGHAWRAGLFTDTLSGPMDDFDPPHPIHICQWILPLLRKGAFTFDKSANDDVLVTYHDPCNPARAGGLMDEPREMIRAVVNPSHFREMAPHTIREKTYCCGAGGGLLTDEIMPVRMAGGKPRAMAAKAVGATYLATPCAICKAQLPEVMKHWQVTDKDGETIQVGGLHDLLSKAIVFKREA